jgi:hypothetical protein
VIKAANTYSLLAMSRHDLSTIGHGSKQTSVTDKEEESETIIEETFEPTRSDDRPRSAHDALRTLSVPDGFDEQEQTVITLYHEIVVASDSSWLPINRFTEQVSATIGDWLADFHDSTLGDLGRIFRAVALNDDRVTIPKRRTLVRLLRENPLESLPLEDEPIGDFEDDPADEDIPF